MTILIIGWVLLLLMQVADVLTTNKVLSQGGRELHPVTQWVMDTFGKSWGIIKVVATLGLVYGATLLFPSYATTVVFTGAIVTLLVVIHNYRNIK